MSARRLTQIALLAVVVVTLALVLRPKGEANHGATTTDQEDANSGTSYVAYYFHGDRRCETCRAIEAQAEAVVRDEFADDLADGTLSWQAVNIDRPENEHFTQEFGMTHSTLVLVEREDGETRRFVSLDRVWELVHEGNAFHDYVHTELSNWMHPGS